MDNEGVASGVVLGLGSNLGDREATIAQALARLGARGYRVTRTSSLYLTEPVGGPPQGWFVNAVADGETELRPEPLLQACLAVEAELGRVRDEPNGPRTLDIDILFYGAERRFVLEPLVEILPELVHPALGLSARELLARCPDPSAVKRLAGAPAR